MDIKNTAYWEIFTDVFQLFKSSLPVRESDEYWDTVKDKSNEIYLKYKDAPESKFAEDQLFSVIDELERLQKEGDNI